MNQLDFMKESTISKVLLPIDSKFVLDIIKRYRADRYMKKLSTLGLIKMFLGADLKEHDGLRAISTDLIFDEDYQQLLGLDSFSHTQLYRRLSSLNPHVLQEIFEHLVGLLRKNNQSVKLSETIGALNIVDASVITKALNGMEWAKYRKTKAGVKLNLAIRYHNDETLYPNKAVITKAKTHDVNQMLEITDFTEGVINVYDRGYVDYHLLDLIHEQGGLFVIRIKKNAATWINTRYENPKGVLAASKGRVGSGKNKSEYEYYYIQKEDDEGNVYHLLSNIPDLETNEGLTFEDVAQIYKLRWQIELFFKWIKQHFKVKHFFGTNETAVTNQLYLSLIMYCLLALFKEQITTKASLNKLRIAIRASLYTCFEQFKQKVIKLNPY